MSDPVTRRSGAIRALLRNIHLSGSGWTLDECAKFLVRQYGYGLRARTARGIIGELVELGVLYSKGLKFYVRKTS